MVGEKVTGDGGQGGGSALWEGAGVSTNASR